MARLTTDGDARFMLNPFGKLIEPRLPSVAVGLDADSAAVVALEKRRHTFALRAAAHVPLPEGMLTPNFDNSNLADPVGLANVLATLAEEAGLARLQRWSAALPAMSGRTAVLVLESNSASKTELSEMLDWKIERSFGAPSSELRVSRQRLANDERGRARYLATAIRLSVIAEYEAVFETLGWQVGLILPRSLGEAQWLMSGARSEGDGLMISSYAQGFTAMIVRDNQPVLIRNAACAPTECADELYRLLLFYRDRGTSAAQSPAGIARLLVVGDGLSEEEVRHCIGEALEMKPQSLTAESLGLALPTPELSFGALAGPIGLATLRWS